MSAQLSLRGGIRAAAAIQNYWHSCRYAVILREVAESSRNVLQRWILRLHFVPRRMTAKKSFLK